LFAALKTHPFAVDAHFEHSLVLAFAVPRAEIEGMLPPCLEPDLFQDKWAFVAVALVETRGLRPAGFPKFLGSDFILIGYRVFVRYTTPSGQRLRGLYILRSETNRKRMEWLGNLFTQYSYHTTDIRQTVRDGILVAEAKETGFRIEVRTDGEDVPLPAGSPFQDWTEARRFAGPMPFTFSYLAGQKKVLIVEGVRENWKPRPVAVVGHHIPFLESLQLKQAVLANAFIIGDIPYHWKKGRLESWQP
jgi:hypothetical protein